MIGLRRQTCAQRLSDLGALRDGMDLKRTVCVCFGSTPAMHSLSPCMTIMDGHTRVLNNGSVIRRVELCSATLILKPAAIALDQSARLRQQLTDILQAELTEICLSRLKRDLQR